MLDKAGCVDAKQFKRVCKFFERYYGDFTIEWWEAEVGDTR